MYQANSRLQRNEWITDPSIPDPENLPEPLGWLIRLRPYPIKNETASRIILADETIDYANYLTNIARVVQIGPCCWNRPEFRNQKNEQFNWVEVGDFVSYPSNVGAKRTFKGVSYLLVCEDEINERLIDPMVYNQNSWQINIPEQDLKKYNTVYNPDYKGIKNV